MEEKDIVINSEVVSICSDLIRIDTSNYGGEVGANERPAAELVTQLLEGAGVTATIYESEPGRANVIGRIEGRDPSRPALLVHCHLDVVPASGLPADDRVAGVVDGHAGVRSPPDLEARGVRGRERRGAEAV